MDYKRVRELIKRTSAIKTDDDYLRLFEDKFSPINYKLYKYYSCDDNSFSNLENDTIFLSSIGVFNDPFDSLFGFSIDDALYHVMKSAFEKTQHGNKFMIEVALNVLFDRIDLNKVSPKMKMYFLLLKDKQSLDISNMSEEEKQRFIQKCVNNKDISDFVKSTKTEDLMQLINVEYTTHLNDHEILELAVFLINNPDVLDYYPLDEEKKRALSFFCPIVKNKSLAERLEAISKVKGNELPDFRSKYDEMLGKINEFMDNFKEKMGKIIYVSCFSEENDNILMWSHYASKHTGFVVEYDLSKLSKKDKCKLLSLFPVIYSDKRPQLSIELMSLHNINKQEYLDTLMSLLLVKNSGWSYEKEWRIIIPNPESHTIHIPASRIIMGLNISDSNKRKLEDLANRKGMLCTQIKMDNSMYRLIDNT